MQTAARSLPGSKSTKPEDKMSKEHETSVQVDSSLLRFIVGPSGVTKAKIENDCGVMLRIPSKSSPAKFASNIIVRGRTKDDVNDAVRQIQEVVEQAVKSPNYQYTHFISLPLAVHESLVKELVTFEEAILTSVRGTEGVSGDVDDVMNGQGEEAEKTAVAPIQKRSKGGEEDFPNPNKADVVDEEEEVAQEPGKEADIYRTKQQQGMEIDKSIFVNAKTFHLTVLMLKLWNQDRIDAAVDILQRTREAVHLALENRPLEIELNGAECMKKNPSKAHVLYARVQEGDQGTRLMSACQTLIDAFVTGGLVMERDQRQPLKLHATLMNTSHRQRGKGPNFRRTPFDATQIIETYGSKEWGKYLVTEAHLSQRFLYDDDGYYHCCGAISFPAP